MPRFIPGSKESISRFWGTSLNIFGGSGKRASLRLAMGYKTPGSNRAAQLAEARAAIRSVRAGTHSLPDLPI